MINTHRYEDLGHISQEMHLLKAVNVKSMTNGAKRTNK